MCSALICISSLTRAPVAPKEIYYEAAKRDPSIGLATVYRMVGTLEDIGVLTRSYHYCLPAKERQDECASA